MPDVRSARVEVLLVSASGHVNAMATWQAGSGFTVDNELAWSRHTSFACN